MNIRHAATFFASLALLIGPAWADPMDDGNAAYERGDYESALKMFRSLAAKQGHAGGQNGVGDMSRDE